METATQGTANRQKGKFHHNRPHLPALKRVEMANVLTGE